MSKQGFTIAEALERDRRVRGDKGPAKPDRDPSGSAGTKFREAEPGKKSTDKGGAMFRCAIDGCGKPSLGSSLFCAEHRAQVPAVTDLRSGGTEAMSREPETWKFPAAHTGPSGYSPHVDPVGASLRIPRPLGLPPCEHRGLVPVLTLKDGRELFAAQGAKLDRADHLDLIVDCAGLVNGRKFVTSNNPRYRTLNLCAFPDVVRLAWPDMTAPTHVGIRFWIRLHGMLPQHTAVACVGGHGRTGTALACLLVADGMTGEEAIKAVREKHCVKAIETVAQEQYIKRLTADRERVGSADPRSREAGERERK